MKPRKYLFLLLLIVLIGTALRFHMLKADVRFQPDEALFSTFARNAAVHGDWMLGGALDKTPASLYASALSMHFVAVYENDLGVRDMTIRQGEFAARLPNALMGIVLIVLTVAYVSSGYHQRLGSVIVVLLVAFSPYALVFSGSAFTDMGMVTFGMLAILAALHKNGWMTGSALAMSFAFKQQGVIFVPLVVMLAWHNGALARRWLLHLGISLGAGLILLLIWDAARPETSIFILAAENNRPGGLFASPDEWLPRLKIWLGYAGWLLGPPIVTFPMLLLIGVYVIRYGRRFDRILGGYVLVYFAAHWLVAFNTYDRYLLPLVPLLAILAGRMVAVTSPLLARLVFPLSTWRGERDCAIHGVIRKG